MEISRREDKMLTLIEIVKDGNKVRAYKCQDNNGNELLLSKTEIVGRIKAGQVTNARVQEYQGNYIVRHNLGSNKPTNNGKGTLKSRNSSKNNLKHDEKSQQQEQLSAREVLTKIASEFGMTNFDNYCYLFFDKWADISNKVYGSKEDKSLELSPVELREMVRFCESALSSYYSVKANKMVKFFDDMEFDMRHIQQTD